MPASSSPASPSQPLRVSRDTARRFVVRSLAAEQFAPFATVDAVIRRLEFVQEDSIDVCGRIHDLILYNRVVGYTPSMLHDTLYGPGASAFEHYFPNLSAIPHDDFPHFVASLRARASVVGRWGGLTDDEQSVADALLLALDDASADGRGALRPRESGLDFGHTVSGWGTRSTKVAAVTEKLWLQGRLAVAGRENFVRRFDRFERVYPALHGWLHDSAELPTPEDTTIHRERKRLRAKRLFRANIAQKKALGAAAFRDVEIEGIAKKWQILAEDADQLLDDRPLAAPDTCLFLAPLDPVVYNRERNEALWDFEYIWEVYTPAAKRRWGYYVLPILLGDRLIGRIEPRRERASSTLKIVSLTLESGVDPASVAAPIAARLADYARFLGLTNIDSPTL